MPKIKIEGSPRIKIQGSGKIRVPFQGDIESTFFYQFFLRPYSSYLRVNYETLELGGSLIWAVFEPNAEITKYNIEHGIGTILKGQHAMAALTSHSFIVHPLLSQTEYVFARFIRVGNTESGYIKDDFETPFGSDEPPIIEDTGFYGDSYDDYYD